MAGTYDSARRMLDDMNAKLEEQSSARRANTGEALGKLLFKSKDGKPDPSAQRQASMKRTSDSVRLPDPDGGQDSGSGERDRERARVERSGGQMTPEEAGRIRGTPNGDSRDELYQYAKQHAVARSQGALTPSEGRAASAGLEPNDDAGFDANFRSYMKFRQLADQQSRSPMDEMEKQRILAEIGAARDKTLAQLNTPSVVGVPQPVPVPVPVQAQGGQVPPMQAPQPVQNGGPLVPPIVYPPSPPYPVPTQPNMPALDQAALAERQRY